MDLWILLRADKGTVLFSGSVLALAGLYSDQRPVCRDMQFCHLALLLLLSAAKFAAWKRKLLLFRDLINSALLFAAMMAENLLHSYLMETRFQIQIVVILCLLIIFIILYALYFTVRDVQNLMQFRAVRRKAEENDEIVETEQTNEINQTNDSEQDSESEPKRKRRSRKKPGKKVVRKTGKKQEVVSSETETETDSEK